jgi:hypothetical protein
VVSQTVCATIQADQSIAWQPSCRLIVAALGGPLALPCRIPTDYIVIIFNHQLATGLVYILLLVPWTNFAHRVGVDIWEASAFLICTQPRPSATAHPPLAMNSPVGCFQGVREELSRVTWPHLHANTGDTLVIVDFPPADAAVCCNGLAWSSVEFQMDSQTLLGTGSGVFTHILSDLVQQRRKRRLRKPLDPGVRYVLDLTPPTEGEESASLVADLSLPAGVRDWWMANHRLNIASHVVLGHDDVCPDHENVPNRPDLVVDSTGEDTRSTEDRFCSNKFLIPMGLEVIRPVPSRQIPEYCPIRHRVAIIRLLLFLRDTELVLNSAPRVWTIIGVAKALDIAHTIRSPVRAWLESEYNSNLIDVHPEIALEMAWKLQLEDLARIAMRIIVVERALESDNRIQPITVFGRPRSPLSDDVENMIEHATIAIRTRIKEANQDMTSDPFEWFGIPYWDDIQQLGVCLNNDLRSFEEGTAERFEINAILEQYNGIVESLRESFRTVILHSSVAPLNIITQNTVDNDRLAYVRRDAFTPVANILMTMSREQSLLIRNFWTMLRDQIFDHDNVFNNTNSPFGSPYYDKSHLWRLNMAISRAQTRGILKNVGARFPMNLPLNTGELFLQLSQAVTRTCHDWAPYPGSLEIYINRTDHLALGLTDDELRFLPLWAGGLDDGTGGVYQEIPLPDADMGPNQPGPAYVTGKTIAPSTTAASDVTMVGGASVQAVRSGADTNISATLSSFTMDSFVQVPSTESEYDWDVRSLSSSVAPLVGEMRNLNMADDEDNTDIEVEVDADSDVHIDAEPIDDDDNDSSSSDDTITEGWSDEWSDLYD